MFKIIIAIFLSVIFFSCQRKKLNRDIDKERIDNVCDKFMQTFANGRIVEALQLLKKKIRTIDSLRITINAQQNNIFPAYGKMLSSEFITERKIKGFVAQRFYILKFEKYYLKVDFTLYKTNSGWTVTHFEYDEELNEILY